MGLRKPDDIKQTYIKLQLGFRYVAICTLSLQCFFSLALAKTMDHGSYRFPGEALVGRWTSYLKHSCLYHICYICNVMRIQFHFVSQCHMLSVYILLLPVIGQFVSDI